jgi:sarcosine oxidase
MDTRCDVVVVGAGLLGLASARALARRGREVIVLEQAEIGHEAGGSKGSCRVFRLGYSDAGYVALARRAREPWAELEDECGQQLLWPTPQLTFGPGLDAVREAMRSAGAPCEPLPAEEAAARFPGVATGGPALLEPESCVISADAALRALAAGAGEVRTGITVTGIVDDGRRVTARTGTGSVTAGAAIVCAGPWTSGLLAGTGITVPAAATQEQVGYLAPAPPSMPIFICYGDYFAELAPQCDLEGGSSPTGLGQTLVPYGLPVPGSALYKIGFHHGGPPADPARQDQRPDERLSAQLAGMARRYLPGLAPDLVQTERCVYDNSPDEDFIVDRVGRVVIGSGTSGHGFKFGPLLGEWLADLAGGGDAGASARRFSLGRFGAGAERYASAPRTRSGC